MKVLVVDDSERLRQSLATGLRACGMVVETAADGAEALVQLGNSPFDVVVLDLVMPRGLAVPAKRMASLLSRVFDSRDRERRFTRSVAHELRIPLAEMRMIADVGAMSDSIEETKAALLEISAATMELQEIIDTLLALARYETGQEQPQTEPVELAGEVRHQLAAFATSIRQRSLRINCDLPLGAAHGPHDPLSPGTKDSSAVAS